LSDGSIEMLSKNLGNSSKNILFKLGFFGFFNLLYNINLIGCFAIYVSLLINFIIYNLINFLLNMLQKIYFLLMLIFTLPKSESYSQREKLNLSRTNFLSRKLIKCLFLIK
jgi:hypothetical protein